MALAGAVSESDIGSAAPGLSASFTVDAFPGRIFRGQVTQVRQAPISVQNVITYDVVITMDNSSLLLKPGMTATARIDTAQALKVLRVPSQALRFTPAGAANRAGGRRQVWVRRGGELYRVPVEIGLDDGAFAEVRSGGLRVGDQVVIGEATTAAAAKPPARSALRL